MSDQDKYIQKKYDYIPISPQLIEHVRRIDGFNDDELCILKKLLTNNAKKMDPSFSFADPKFMKDPVFRRFLEMNLKIHQIFALVDVTFEPVFPQVSASVRQQNLITHFQEISEELTIHQGLNYVPRERSNDGRTFEHAADSYVLIDHLGQLDENKTINSQIITSQGDLTYFVKIVDELLQNKDQPIEDENLSAEIKMAEKFSQKIMEELKIKNDQIVLQINKAFINLTIKANGKADLYFHAYFWEQYLKSLQDFQSKNTKVGQISQSKKSQKPSKKPLTDNDNSEQNLDDSAEVNNLEKSSSQNIEIFGPNYPFMSRLVGLSNTMTKVIINIKKFPFNEKIYQKFLTEFAQRQNPKKAKFLEEIQRALFVAQIADDQEGLIWIEKLLIQLQGYCDISIRDQAIVLLNMLYDGVDWQLQEAFRPVIRSVGQHFFVNVVVHKNPNGKQIQELQMYLGLGAPSPIIGNNKHLLTWHKIEARNIVKEDNLQYEICINFGKFWKCGFYDWRLVSITDDGKLQPLEIIGKPEPVFPSVNSNYDDYYNENEDNIGSIAQGRFIVHARGVRDQSFHEVQIDYQGAKVDKNENRFIQRGTFSEVERAIPDFARQGIDTLYLAGTLERDNYPFQNKYSNQTEYRREDASSLAALDRSIPNKMLGGALGLSSISKVAKRYKIKIIVDSLARISSSRHHRKYKDLLLNYLDEDGRRHICYGTDGQALKYEDTAMLNYRKIEAWELLIQEVINYTKQFGFDGIHLDNGQAWPQIMEPDIEELLRLDVDGQPAYTAEDFMNGEVVIRNENYGYWNSNNMETYPNPFFIKMAKRLWYENPEFIIIGECWGGFMFEHRQIILARSGVIPRLFKLPMALSTLFGKNLSKDGAIQPCQKDTVVAIKQWYDEIRRFLPDGTILMQSSTSHSLPYPAYLYGKGTWAAIDTLFFMPDLPITFNNELDGQVFKIGEQRTVFQHEQTELSATNPGELKRTNSQIMKVLQHHSESSVSMTNSKELDSSKISELTAEQRRGLLKVSSGINIAENYLVAKEGKIHQKEQQFKQQEMAPEKGFDLSKINTHYIHRRRLRREKMVLRYGELIFLTARSLENQFCSDVLVYARYSLMETVIIATNMNEATRKFTLDLSQLLPTFKKAYGNNTVVMIKNVISGEKDPEYYFLREFIELRSIKTLLGYRSLMISVTICEDDQFIFKKCLTSAIERTKKNLLAHRSIENEQISLLFSDCVEYNPADIHRFANVIGSLQTSFLDKLGVSFKELFITNQKLSTSVELSSKLIAMCSYLVKKAGGQLISPIRAASSISESNKLGPIIFCTPEIGRWSTAGGLGVMVDELSIGLADLGQEVIVISPYYERNRQGKTGYLAQDPAGFKYIDNINVTLNYNYTLGVHEGTVSGVKLVFLHNGDLFPTIYPDAKPDYITTQIAVFDKACLEYLCQRQIVPAVCVTNDWFTGFVAAYAKIGAFGETFKGTTFLHICHNLQESYEGRIYLDPIHGSLESIHQLPKDWLIDNQWKQVMINPSRCAIMLSDQWSTVSKSYRDDLLNTSSLAWLLKQKPLPFAFPNGIPIAERLRKLDAIAPDHLSAKRLIQQKYFNFQDLDDSIPLFAFVGRVTAQKGVHLILEIAEHIIQKSNYKVQILVGGPANMREPYSAGCAHQMWSLRAKYPHCFWAAPEEFFTDGSLLNRGTDFGLMPSVFEPGGIVQHEFFVGGTPVIAFKTGGLKDSVIEFQWDSEEGSGFTFESHKAGDFIFAVERAIGTFKNKQKYLKLRENAFKATMDGEIVSKAWLAEFFRLRGKIFVDYTVISKLEKQFPPWNPADYVPISIIQEIFGQDKKKQIYQEIDFGATDGEIQGGTGDNLLEIQNIMSAFDQLSLSKQPWTFRLHNRGPRHNKVELCGSFDDWQVRHDMQFDPFTNQWFITMLVKTNEEYFYKYIINSTQWVVNDEETKKNDGAGNINNVCFLQL